jgi:DNA invertase Pin-like site-specific DNA recombinase
MVEYWYADTVSGKAHAAQRKQCGLCWAGCGAKAILVVSKLDRRGRNTPDVPATIKSLAALHVEVVVLQLGKTDLTSTAGKLLLAMLAAVAEMECDLIVEWTAGRTGPRQGGGATLGRPSRTTPEQRKAMAEGYGRRQSVSALARLYGVSRATVLSIVKLSREAKCGCRCASINCTSLATDGNICADRQKTANSRRSFIDFNARLFYLT